MVQAGRWPILFPSNISLMVQMVVTKDKTAMGLELEGYRLLVHRQVLGFERQPRRTRRRALVVVPIPNTSGNCR